MSTFYVTPSDSDLIHHGVLGMKWGVRRYQPYSVVPRGSGQGGKEIGEAARYGSSNSKDRRIAKKNINTAYKEVKSTFRKRDRYEDKLKGTEMPSKKEEKYKDAVKRYDTAMKELENAELVLGTRDFNKALDSAAVRSIGLKWFLGGIYSVPFSLAIDAPAIDLIKDQKAVRDAKKLIESENSIKSETKELKINNSEKSSGAYTKDNLKMTTDKWGFKEATVKNVSIICENEDKVVKAANAYKQNESKIKKLAMDAIMEDKYIPSWGEDAGLSKEQFKNALDIKSISLYGNKTLGVSIWEKNDNDNILGGHSIDIEFDIDDIRKPRYVSMNG